MADPTQPSRLELYRRCCVDIGKTNAKMGITSPLLKPSLSPAQVANIQATKAGVDRARDIWFQYRVQIAGISNEVRVSSMNLLGTDLHHLAEAIRFIPVHDMTRSMKLFLCMEVIVPAMCVVCTMYRSERFRDTFDAADENLILGFAAAMTAHAWNWFTAPALLHGGTEGHFADLIFSLHAEITFAKNARPKSRAATPPLPILDAMGGGGGGGASGRMTTFLFK